MAFYRCIGDVPLKRHTQFRDPDGRLYAEELMGEEGFFSDSSLLYHREIPSALVDVRTSMIGPPANGVSLTNVNGGVFPTGGPLADGIEPLITIHDGNQKQVLRKNVKASSILITDLPFFDNFGDNYTVVAWAPGFEQAGYTPVPVRPAAPGHVDIMLLKEDGGFNFSNSKRVTADLRQRFCVDQELVAEQGLELAHVHLGHQDMFEALQ